MTDPIYVADPPNNFGPPAVDTIYPTDITADFNGQGSLSATVKPAWPSARPFLENVMLKHQQTCGCTLPLNKSEAPPQLMNDGRAGWLPLPPAYFGKPMDQPSDYQNRTTDHTHRQVRQRHPTNPVKPYTILQFFIDNPSGTPGEVPPSDHGKP